MWIVKWFKTLDEAKAYAKKNGGCISKGTPRSHSKIEHYQWASAFGFDPEEYPYSVARRER